MQYSVDTLNSFVENSVFFEIPSLHNLELVSVRLEQVLEILSLVAIDISSRPANSITLFEELL